MTNPDKNSKQNGILAGLKIVELSHYIAGPLTGMLLADQGAEVIHIINPHEKSFDPIEDAILGRGKTHIRLDLKESQNLAQLIELINQADIVIDNFAPNVLKKLGIDLDAIRKLTNRQLISVSIPAFLETDARSASKGWEGVAGMAGLIYERPLKTPGYHTFPVGSILSALYAVNAILAAMMARIRDGQGQHLTVSLYESDVFAQILQVLVMNQAPRAFMPLKLVGTPFMGVWQCADEKYIYVHITMPAHNAQMIETFAKNGYEEDIKRLKSVMSPATIQDPSMISSLSEASKIKEILRKIYHTKTTEEWENLLGKQFCVIKLRNLEDWVNESIRCGMNDCIKISDPVFDQIISPGPAIYSPDHPPQISPRKFSSGQISDITKKWESDAKSQLKTHPPLAKEINRPPLEGIRILDISRIIAGPFAARILAEFGADVISLQSPTNLDWAMSFHVLFNAGKRSVTMDFQSEEGRKSFWQFLELFKPHVLIQNYRNLEFTKQIGLDYDTIKSRLPEIVYTYLNAYGIQGEWQNRPAFEQVIQAVTGIQLEYVGTKRPKIFPFPILDMGAGLVGSFATLLGVYNQQTQKQGGFYHVHMTTTAMLLQLPGFSRFQQKRIESTDMKPEVKKLFEEQNKIHQSIVSSLNYHMMISGPEKDLETWFAKEKALKTTKKIFAEQLEEVIPKFSRFPYRFWVKSLKQHNLFNKIGLMRQHKCSHIFHYTKKYDKSPMPLVVKKDYPGLTSLSFIHTPIHMYRTPIVDVNPSPIRGTHTEEIFKILGKEVPKDKGLINYPKDAPLLPWLWNFALWGLYAIRSGSI